MKRIRCWGATHEKHHTENRPPWGIYYGLTVIAYVRRSDRLFGGAQWVAARDEVTP